MSCSTTGLTGLRAGEAGPDPFGRTGEQLPGRVAGVAGDVVEHDEPHGASAPAQIIDARPGGWLHRWRAREQPAGAPGGHCQQGEVTLGGQAVTDAGGWPRFRCCRLRLEFTIIHVVANQFIQRPGVQWFMA